MGFEIEPLPDYNQIAAADTVKFKKERWMSVYPIANIFISEVTLVKNGTSYTLKFNQTNIILSKQEATQLKILTEY
jgi:hypothetical protein